MNKPKTRIDQLVGDLDNGALADLLTTAQSSASADPDDLKERWTHLVSLPVDLVINQLPKAWSDTLRPQWEQLQTTQLPVQGAETLEQILARQTPGVATLQFIKEIGKAINSEGQSRWPTDLGYALYFAAYALALLEPCEPPGGLDRHDLRNGLSHHGRCPWIAPWLRKRFQQALARV